MLPARYALLCFVLLLPLESQGQGLIIDRDFRPVALELREHRIEGDVEEHVAVVTVAHEFVNTGGQTVEGTFLFPLPPEAQVSRFSMTADGKEMTGEILAADEARRIYEDIVRRSLDPALLELADYRTFRARVFPIPPGASRTITLRYDVTLPVDGGTAVFRHPLQGDLSARAVGGPPPRPWPQPMHGQEDAARPGRGPATHTFIQVNLHSERGLRNLYAPSHQVETRREGDRAATVTFEQSGVLHGGDFVLYYTMDEADLGATLLSHRPYRDRPGYFLLLLDPPPVLDEAQIQAQEVVFVLDTSGSMAGEKMEQAKAALRHCLDHLGPRDRFGIVAFSSDVDAFRDELRPADAREDAGYFVDQLEARGGTNIHAALLEAADLLEGSERGLVVFVTDGLPSVGTADEGEIRKTVVPALGDARVFAFGVGYDVNTRLLDGLARDTGAFADYISPDESIETRIAAFFDKVRSPVMTDLRIDLDGGDVFAWAPGDLPDLYRGQQIVVAGRYRRPGAATLTLRGQLAGQNVTRRFDARFPEIERDRDFVARLWATRRVGHLLEAIRLNGENEELIEEITALAKEYGLVTPYTSYLVLEDEAMAGNAPPDGLREGLSMDAVAASPEAMRQESGRDAVTASKRIRAYREADAVLPPAPGGGSAAVEGRLLRRSSDGAWTDTEFEQGGDVLRIRFTSDAYFAFLRLYPDALPFARLGERVTFRFRDRWVQIGADGEASLNEAQLRRWFE